MTTNSFPLFNQLSRKINLKQLTPLHESKKQQCVDVIRKMGANEHELVFALIRNYQLETNENDGYTLPYKSKHQKTGIKFDLEKLPFELQYILYEFVQLYLQSNQSALDMSIT